MAVVVDDHVHLGDAGDFVVDLDAKEPVFREVVPVLVVFFRAFVVVFLRFVAHGVERVEEKAARTAGRVEHDVLVSGLGHFHGEGNDFARREVLAEVALEKAIHELLEGQPFGVEVGLAQIDAFQMRDDSAQAGVVNLDRLGENVRSFCFCVS